MQNLIHEGWNASKQDGTPRIAQKIRPWELLAEKLSAQQSILAVLLLSEKLARGAPHSDRNVPDHGIVSRGRG